MSKKTTKGKTEATVGQLQWFTLQLSEDTEPVIGCKDVMLERVPRKEEDSGAPMLYYWGPLQILHTCVVFRSCQG